MNTKRSRIINELEAYDFNLAKAYAKIYGVKRESAQVLATGLLKSPAMREAIAALILGLEHKSLAAEKLLLKVIEKEII